MIASEARVAAVLEDAKEGFYAGSVADQEAVSLAQKLGYVEFAYSGTAGFLGLAKLSLTDAGKAALEEFQ